MMGGGESGTLRCVSARILPTLAAFALGACTTAAVQSAAAPPPSDAPPQASASAPPEGLLVRADQAQRRRAPNGTATITVLARGEEAFLGQLQMEPGAAVPEHRDATEEYIHVLQGRGTMTLDGHRFEVGPGDTVYMPANAKVSFQNGAEPMRAIQVFSGPQPADKYEAWTEL